MNLKSSIVELEECAAEYLGVNCEPFVHSVTRSACLLVPRFLPAGMEIRQRTELHQENKNQSITLNLFLAIVSMQSEIIGALNELIRFGIT